MFVLATVLTIMRMNKTLFMFIKQSVLILRETPPLSFLLLALKAKQKPALNLRSSQGGYFQHIV